MRAKTCLVLILKVGKGLNALETESTLPLRSWDEKENVSLSMMGMGEQSLLKILLRPWRTYLGISIPEAVEGERVDPEVTVTGEVNIDRGTG